MDIEEIKYKDRIYSILGDIKSLVTSLSDYIKVDNKSEALIIVGCIHSSASIIEFYLNGLNFEDNEE